MLASGMWTANFGALLVLGVLLLGTVLMPRRTLDAPAWTLLRCFFPAWRFFEEIAPAPQLCVRVAGDDGVWSAFAPLLRAPPRTLGALVLNAGGNLYLAERSLLERFAHDLEERPGADPSALVSYHLVQRLVALRVAELGGANRYQFKLTADDTELFVSATCST